MSCLIIGLLALLALAHCLLRMAPTQKGGFLTDNRHRHGISHSATDGKLPLISDWNSSNGWWNMSYTVLYKAHKERSELGGVAVVVHSVSWQHIKNSQRELQSALTLSNMWVYNKHALANCFLFKGCSVFNLVLTQGSTRCIRSRYQFRPMAIAGKVSAAKLTDRICDWYKHILKVLFRVLPYGKSGVGIYTPYILYTSWWCEPT